MFTSEKYCIYCKKITEHENHRCVDCECQALARERLAEERYIKSMEKMTKREILADLWKRTHDLEKEVYGRRWKIEIKN